jgi:Fur family transcriptional regulator, ferric uptake regulator
MRGSGGRRTHQRGEILRELEEAEGFQSAQQLHMSMSGRGIQVGLATVYRTLQALASSGDLDVLQNESGESIYRRCDSSQHHHHLVCRACGVSIELPSAEVESWAARIVRLHGFSEVTHVAELFGLCSNCSTST